MNGSVQIALSNVDDGSMSRAVDDTTKLANRSQFLKLNNISVDKTILVGLEYSGDDYKRYKTVSSNLAGDGLIRQSSMIADAIFAQDAGIALFLPIADCIAAVLYDPIHHVLGMSHLGRHNLVQNGGAHTIEYMVNEFSSLPGTVQVWLSPAAGKDNYPLFDFNDRSLHEVATEQLLSAGIGVANIVVDDRDTTVDSELFSHSEFLKGNQAVDGRQAVAALMV